MRPSARRTTLADIAQAAGVSVATVSKVVNGRGDVAPRTRARVQELLHDHDYLAPVFRHGGPVESPTIEVQFQGSLKSYVAETLEGIIDSASELGASVVISKASRAPHWARDLVSAGRRAVIAVTSVYTSAHLNELARSGLPLVADRVAAYTGLRTVTVDGESLYLNGRRLFVRGVLDQGYWPETGITAPDDAALRRDIELAAEAGYNLVRKHLKLEDPRFAHHADTLGMLLWAEPASPGRFSPASTAAFAEQIEPMVERDGNSPAIVIWGLYNEEWGLDWDIPGDPAKQRATADAYDRLKALDRRTVEL